MIDWHYPRPALARTQLGHLFDRGIDRLAFFGRRGIGKTEFMREDLIPTATQRGIRSLYCSFWENKDRPHLAYIRALQNAMSSGAIKPKFKVNISAGIDLSAEIERAERPRPALPSDISMAAGLFSEWCDHLAGKPGLVILDEVQHLATSSQFDPFAASLRTMLDMAPRQIKVIFTGSSLSDLQQLFQDNKAPFFNFATVQDFPALDRSFVEHLLAVHRQITGLHVSTEELSGLFDRVGHNAQLLTGLVQQMVLHQTTDWQCLWESIERERLGQHGWCEKQWAELSLSDQAVYLRLLEGKDPYAEESLKLYAELGFSRGTAQQAQKRLINRSLIHKTGHGVYERSILMLDEWIQAKGLTSQGLVSKPRHGKS